MVIEVVSKENAEEYRGFLPDSFYRTEIPLGIVCIDEEEDVPIGFAMLILKCVFNCNNFLALYNRCLLLFCHHFLLSAMVQILSHS